MVVIEDKLSSSTRLTTPQSGALKSSSYRVRNVESKTSQFGTSNSLNKNDVLNFQNGQIKWYKVHDGTDGTVILGINKIQ